MSVSIDRMTPEERLRYDENADYVGDAIKDSLELVEQMKPMPICVICPMGQWYRREDGKGAARLECFCTEFRGVMYGSPKDPVTVCDGRTDAIERMDAKNAQDG